MPRNIPPNITKNLLVDFCRFVINSSGLDLKLSDSEWGSMYQLFKKANRSTQVYGLVYLNWKTAKAFGFYPEDLLPSVTRSRRRTIVRARQASIYVMREFGFSYRAIGNYYGLNHSTAMHSYETVKRDMISDLKLREKVTTLLDQLTSSSSQY